MSRGLKRAPVWLNGVVIALALIAIVAVTALASPSSSSKPDPTQKLCVTAFPGANRTTHGATTLYNRQASVQLIACQKFGYDAKFEVDGGVVCAVLSAAIGVHYDRLHLFVDSSCSSAELAANHDVGTASAATCAMLSDLLAAAPWAKAYATGAGLACAFGKPLGNWIESKSEQVAAEGVIRSGKCLKFTTHTFPLTDDWSAVKCQADDPGFSDLPSVSSPERPTQVVEMAPVNSSYLPAPGFQIDNRGVAQTCIAGSDSVGNAYRCVSGHYILDPCWTDSSDPAHPAVICQGRPWDKRVYRLRVGEGGLQPFFGPPLAIGAYEPWGVELNTGERCVALGGAHATVNGGRKVIDYACYTKAGKPDDRLLLRGIDRSHPRWRIASATYNLRAERYKLGPKLRIVTAWYAMQDEGDALAAAANTCSASAIAFAAEAYEAAHNEPHGPLPDIVAHACAGGYAIALFVREAPSPGYEAAFALRATPSGWAVVGSSDYIGPGEFGIPEATYEQIRAGLDAAPYEKVPF